MTAPGLALTVNHTPSGVELTVGGELDLATAGSLVSTATDLIAGPASTLTLDLSGVRFCDSSGLSALIKLRSACDDGGWELRVSRLSEQLTSLIAITGLHEHLRVAD